MKKYLLSIIIPSRNEIWLSKTIEDILEHKSPDTEIIVGLDGKHANPPIKDHKDVTILYVDEAIGQRAMTNQLAKLSRAKFIQKTDAHCSFSQGFDIEIFKMFEKVGDNVTMAPIMRNLWAFDWVCPEGHRRYQGPDGPCKVCGKETVKDVLWISKKSPQSTTFLMDVDPHFQYFGQYKKRPEYIKSIEENGYTESMILQGSCFIATREKYWELGLCDEDFGSWGSMGIEVACKTWLSGGRVLVNHNCWYAHLFRTQGGTFSFPYQQKESKVQDAKSFARDLFYNNKWDKQVRPLSWLIEKFKPIPSWHEESGKKILAKINKAGEDFMKKKNV